MSGAPTQADAVVSTKAGIKRSGGGQAASWPA